MSRSASVAACMAVLVLATSARSADVEAAVRDARALTFLARRHHRMWGWVDGRIGAMQADLEEPDERTALAEIRYRFILDWARDRARGPDEERVDDLIGIYGRALGVGLPIESTGDARTALVDLRLSEADRLREAGSELAAASEHVQAVLRMEGLPAAVVSRARDLGFRIDSHEAERLLDSGDLTRGYDRMREVVERYGDMDIRALVTARERLAMLERTTGVLTIRLFDASKALASARPAVVGEPLPLPSSVRLYRRLADYRVTDAPDADVPLERDGPTRIRLSLADVTQFSLRLAFLGGRRPELRLPVDLSRRAQTLLLPDRIPVRMAFVPAGEGHEAFFIGLYEVSVEEWNAYLASRRATPRRVRREGMPVDLVTWEEVQGFCRFAGAELPTLREWRDAALGSDGRPLPWGRSAAKARAAIDSGAPEPVDARADDVSPFGLHHVLGNVWELIEGGFAMGGSINTPYPLRVTYSRVDGSGDVTWEPDLLRDPRPLAPAAERMEPGDELRRKWMEYLFRDRSYAEVKQDGIGFRVAIRIESR